jgi:hypothetical protein
MNSAEKSLLELVRHVFDAVGDPEPLTYQELAFRIGRINKHDKGHANGMGKVLEKMGNLLRGVADDWGKAVPHIQSLVVAGYGSGKGLPSDGIKEFWPGYPELTKKEKENRSRLSYREIREFGSRWNWVLERLGLPQVTNGDSKSVETSRGRGEGGESSAHLALKDHIARNPQLVGASEDDEVFQEYPLPSLDVIDVLFRGLSQWIAVEVKSRISDNLVSDYERGLYQCVKYRALIEAMRKDSRYRVPDQITVILLIETSLPAEYRNLYRKLGVSVIENVTPDSSPST